VRSWRWCSQLLQNERFAPKTDEVSKVWLQNERFANTGPSRGAPKAGFCEEAVCWAYCKCLRTRCPRFC
jgi:hypothetical protein